MRKNNLSKGLYCNTPLYSGFHLVRNMLTSKLVTTAFLSGFTENKTDINNVVPAVAIVIVNTTDSARYRIAQNVFTWTLVSLV